MSDKRLLEMAAKAAGINLEWIGEGRMAACFDPVSEREWWDPLTDDGDALRLAVKLGICFGPNFDGDKAVCFGPDGRNITELLGSGPYAATRRAIVRAAAEIGKAMP